MGRSVDTTSQAHNNAVLLAEGVRQATMVAGVTQAQATAADVAFYRACIVSAKANGLQYGTFQHALVCLGTGGI